ncbi:uncharacterized protein [Dysidea avara]|uniref:uncharacterized protein n=1 Tax=Dysidea avara TaxID=196820 RepID=UPI00332FDAAE
MKKSDIEHIASCIWSKAVKIRPGLTSTYFKLLYDGEKSDVKHAPSYVEEKSIANVLFDRFFGNFGDNAFPVLNTITADKLYVLQQELRRKVEFCNKNLMDILNRSGRILDPKDELNFQRKQYISLVDLREDERMVFHHAMAMVHMVESDFPEAILDIVESDKMVLLYAESRLDLPCWMLSTELVHAKKMPCTSSNCMCAATCLCTGVMQAWQAWQGGRHNFITRHVMLTSLLATQASDRAHPYCKEVHENKDTARTLTDEEYEQMKERERDLEKNKDEILV